jgi:hypothetical protein
MTTIDHVFSSVAEAFDVSVDAMMGRGRSQAIAEARHVAMFLAQKHTRLSLAEIAWNTGRRHHTTAMYAIERIKTRLATDANLLRLVGAAEKKLADPRSEEKETPMPRRATGLTPRDNAMRGTKRRVVVQADRIGVMVSLDDGATPRFLPLGVDEAERLAELLPQAITRHRETVDLSSKSPGAGRGLHEIWHMDAKKQAALR